MEVQHRAGTTEPSADGPAGIADKEAIKMTDVGQAATGARSLQQAVTLPPRSPVRAAILSAVTLTLYGFWWWWELNRELRARGEATHPWRALDAVTLGWAVIVAPFRSVYDTTAAVAAAQRRTGLAPAAHPKTAVGLAITAAAGLVLFATSIVFPPGFFLFGWIPPVFGMALVWYEQQQFNRVVGTEAVR
jgi:hypothetical protein